MVRNFDSMLKSASENEDADIDDDLRNRLIEVCHALLLRPWLFSAAGRRKTLVSNKETLPRTVCLILEQMTSCEYLTREQEGGGDYRRRSFQVQSIRL